MTEGDVRTEQLLQALWKKKWIILLCVVLSTALTLGAAALFLKPAYETTVVFLLEGEQPEVLVESARYILQTRQTLDAVLEKVDADLTREELEKMISVQNLGTTPLLEVTVSTQDPAKTKCVADAVAEVLPLRLAQVMEHTQTQIVDAPEYPDKAEPFQAMTYLLLGLLVGLAVPVTVISLQAFGKRAL